MLTDLPWEDKGEPDDADTVSTVRASEGEPASSTAHPTSNTTAVAPQPMGRGDAEDVSVGVGSSRRDVMVDAL